MAERTAREDIEFVRRCLDILDEDLTREDKGAGPIMSPSGRLCPVLNAKAALDRIDESLTNSRPMSMDGKMMRDLWSVSRHMQTNMHHIASQVWALKSVLERLSIRDEQVLKIVGNIKELAEYCYGRGKKEELCFPNVCEALHSAKARMEERGIWREWSDDIGFPKEEDSMDKETKHKEV